MVAPAFVTSTDMGHLTGAGTSFTFTFTATSGNGLILVLQSFNSTGGVSAVAGGEFSGFTWTKLQELGTASSTDGFHSVWVLAKTAGGSITLTITLASTGGGDWDAGRLEYSGQNTTTFIEVSSGRRLTSASTTFAETAITTTTATDTLLATAGSGAVVPLEAGSNDSPGTTPTGYTQRYAADTSGLNANALVAKELVLSAAGLQNATYTFSGTSAGSTRWSGAFLALKPQPLPPRPTAVISQAVKRASFY